MEQKDLFIQQGDVFAKVKHLEVFPDEKNWFRFKDESIIPLHQLNVILMRKDPPVDTNYIYTTYF